jgi:hypothetical protein
MEKDTATDALEECLWAAADQSRADPPFNFNTVDKERLKDYIGPGRRFPFTEYQRSRLRSIGLDTVGKALQASEAEFQRISYVGPKRSRKMMNVVVSSVLEYLSG